MMDASAACHVVRIHGAAGLALVRNKRDPHGDGETRWVPWPPEAAAPSHTLTDEPEGRGGDVIHLHGVPNKNDDAPPPSLALQREHFADARVAFSVAPSADALPPQNVLVFLHGRGDSHEPFARLGQQMALPQTAVISLRAPLKLPFDMGPTWIDDLDDDYNVIPPTVAHRKRSDSLQAASEYVVSFLTTLRDKYHWRLDRVFLFGFSQGASVAFHVARSMPWRLGGVVLVAGGTVKGPHADLSMESKRDHETPALLLCGGRDDVFPLSLAEQSEKEYAAAFTNAKLLSRVVFSHKPHDMIRSADEMRVVMAFFSKHLHLRNIALEARSDLIEITN